MRQHAWLAEQGRGAEQEVDRNENNIEKDADESRQAIAAATDALHDIEQAGHMKAGCKQEKYESRKIECRGLGPAALFRKVQPQNQSGERNDQGDEGTPEGATKI